VALWVTAGLRILSDPYLVFNARNSERVSVQENDSEFTVCAEMLRAGLDDIP